MEKKAYRRGNVENIGNEQFIRGRRECFTLRRAEAKNILEDATRERQEGIQGQWQQESPFREILEHVRGNVDMGCGLQMMRKGFFANKGWQLERVQRRMQRKKGSHQNGPSREYAMLTRKWREMKLDVWVWCRKS